MARTATTRLAAGVSATDVHGWLRWDWAPTVLAHGDVGTQDRQWLYDFQRRAGAHRAEVAFLERLLDLTATCQTAEDRGRLDELVHRHIVTVRPADVRDLLRAAQREDHFVSVANPPQLSLLVAHVAGAVRTSDVDAATEATRRQIVASRDYIDAAYGIRPRPLHLAA